jgi:hypothetical protein
MIKKLALVAGMAVAGFASGAQAIPIANGDLLVVLQKSGTEVLVNLGDYASSHSVDLTAASSTLGGLEGAKVAVVGVIEPGRTMDFGFGAFPAENILFSTLPTSFVIDDLQIEVAMNSIDSALASAAWFWQLRSVPSNVIQTSASFSYQSNLGLGTDRIASALSFSIAGLITGGNLNLDIISAARGYPDFGGPSKVVEPAGSLVISGNSLVYSAVPEPGTLVLLAAGLGGLAAFQRRQARA